MIKLEDLLTLTNMNHTQIQMDRFITVKSGGTAYGCLFQALRELNTRYQTLRSEQITLARNLIKLKAANYKLENATISQESASLSRLKVAGLELRIEGQRSSLRATQREFLRFYSQASMLYKLLGFDKEAPTLERLSQLEEERWEYRILADAALSLIQSGVISSSVVSMIQCLPLAFRNRLLQRCFGSCPEERQQRMQELTQWYMTYEFEMPEVLELSQQETQEVLECCELSSLPKLLGNSLQMGADSLHESSIKNGSASAKLVNFEEVLSVASVDAL